MSTDSSHTIESDSEDWDALALLGRLYRWNSLTHWELLQELLPDHVIYAEFGEEFAKLGRVLATLSLFCDPLNF